jgi:purine catabolism regulator
VILEDLAHRVLAYEVAGRIPRGCWRGSRRVATVAPAARTAYDGPSGWLVTTVGARGRDWGRVIPSGGGTPPGPGDVVLVERMATTLALGRLLTRQHQSLERAGTRH